MTKAKRKAPARRRLDQRDVQWLLHQKAAYDLHVFTRLAWPVIEPETPFKDNWHVEALCRHLEAVTDGRIGQLLANVPPGTMKSLLVCVMWPAWVWIKHPAKQFMFATYAKNFTLRDSVRCRNLLLSDWYQGNWPLELRDDQNTKGLYENAKGGWRLATSVEGEGTGLHPHFIGVDDPHKVKEAESDADRQAVLDWWDGTMSSRGVGKGVRRVCIMQRVHANDLASHLESKGTWVKLCLPMRYEAPTESERGGQVVLVPRMPETPIGFQDPRMVDGELLWPALYPEDKVRTLETEMGAYHAAGQLQQRPSPRGGGMFKRGWFRLREEAPPCVKMVRYWDKAGTEGGDGARTSGVLMGRWRDPSAELPAMREKYVVLNVKSARLGAAEREGLIKQTAQTDKATWGYVETWVEQEPGSGGKESAEGTVGNLAGFTCKVERVTGSKETRAEPMASQASVGKIEVLARPWASDYLDELSMFPLGKLKDQVDASSGAFNKLHIKGTGAVREGASFYTGKSDFSEGGFRADRISPADL